MAIPTTVKTLREAGPPARPGIPARAGSFGPVPTRPNPMLSDTTHRILGTVSREADWQEAVTFSAFLPTAADNVGLWHGVYERASPPADLVARAAAVRGTWHLLVLSEDWCGDAANTVPVLARFAEAAPDLDLRILARDRHPALMDAHLTGTSRSIPVVMLLDGAFAERGWWGPRPADLQRWALGDGKAMEPDARYREIRKWYARDHGRTTISEVVDLLEAVTARNVV